MDLSAELKLVKRNALSLKPWLDAFEIMRIVVLNVVIGTVAGWAAAALFAIALTDSRAHFLVSIATTYVAVTLLGSVWLFALAVTKAIRQAPPESKARSAVTEHRLGSMRAVLMQLLRATAPVLLACFGLAPLSMQLLVWVDTHGAYQCAHVHVYLVVFVGGLFAFAAGAKTLQLLQQRPKTHKRVACAPSRFHP